MVEGGRVAKAFAETGERDWLRLGGGDDGLSAAIIAAIVIFSVICVAGLVIAWAVIGTRSPDSTLGTSWAATRDFFTGFVEASISTGGTQTMKPDSGAD